MNPSCSVCVNERKIAHDTIDGEVIVINFENGQYFSLQNTAATVWQWLVEGHRISDILDHTAATWEEESAVSSVDSFIRQLIAEGLLDSGEAEPRERADLPEIEPQEPFRPPELTKYEDMQELILLDPIHEVGATGWPNRAAS